MQGFFRKPVDDLHAEPLIARWIRAHVPNWKESVVVSKNTGGTKRVTSLADVLKVNFALVTTDRRRTPMYGSGIFDASEIFEPAGEGAMLTGLNLAGQIESELQNGISRELEDPRQHSRASRSIRSRNNGTANAQPASHRHAGGPPGASPLVQSTRVDSESPPVSRSSRRQDSTGPNSSRTRETSDTAEEFTDERAREVVTGRLVQGHIVDDDFPSPILSTMSSSIATLPADQIEPSQYEERDLMTSSFVSTTSSVAPDHALGGTGDATATSDEEEEVFKNPDLEHTITLVGNVKNRTVLIMDDMIDKAGSWIAAAETVVKRGDAKKVYCIATHGLFGDDSLERMEDCQCIDSIVVTNSFPIASDKIKASKKLVVLDLSHLLSEAIRRNHHGESISQLYQHYQD
ncbi:hypothetical protein MMC20_001770 [Loxospora ochrophaea]|nr:hypothetical protein [Loxospora ochrophaea]